MATVISELKVIDGQNWVTKKLGSDAKYITYTPSGGKETTLNTAIDNISNDVTLNNKAVNFMTSGNKANSNLAYDVNKFTLGGGDYITSGNNDEGMNPVVTLNSLALNGTSCKLVQSVTPSGCSIDAKVINVTSDNTKSEVTGKSLYDYYWSTDECSIYIGKGSYLTSSYDSTGGYLTKVSSNIIGSSKFPLQQAWGSKSSYTVKSTVPIVQTTGAIALGSEIDMWSGTGSMTNVKPSAIIKDDTTNSEIVIKNGDTSKTKGLYVQSGIGTAGDLVVGSGVTTTSEFKNGGNIISKGCVISKSGMSIGYDPDSDWDAIISNVGQSDGGGNLAVKGNITSTGLIEGATAALTGSSSYSTQAFGISKGMVAISNGRLQLTKDSTNGVADSGIYLTGKGYGLQIDRTDTTTLTNSYSAKITGGQVYISSSGTFDSNNIPALYVNNNSYFAGSKNHINGIARIKQMEAGFSGAVAPNTGSESVTFSTNWASGTTISAQTKDSSNTSYYADALTVKNGRTLISGTNSSGVGLRVDKDISVGGGVTSGGTVKATSLVTDSLTWNNSSTASLSVGSLSTNGLTVNGASSLKGKATITTGGLAVTGATTLSGNTSVTGTLTSSGKLTVSANGAAITGATSIAGNTSVTGTLTSSDKLTVSANGAAITGNTSTSGTLTVGSTSTLKGKLTVSTGGLSVTGGTGLLGDLSVTGTSTLSNGLTVKGDSDLKGGAVSTGTLTISGPITQATTKQNTYQAQNTVFNNLNGECMLSIRHDDGTFAPSGTYGVCDFYSNIYFKNIDNDGTTMYIGGEYDTNGKRLNTKINLFAGKTYFNSGYNYITTRPVSTFLWSNYAKEMSFLDLFFPVGCVIVNSDPEFNPKAYYGGNWEKISGGRCLFSAGTIDYYEKEVVTISPNNLAGSAMAVAGEKRGIIESTGGFNGRVMISSTTCSSMNEGATTPVYPPYYSAYFWKRVKD